MDNKYSKPIEYKEKSKKLAYKGKSLQVQEIKEKAAYCLHCKVKPCQKGCPLQNNIPDFIEKIKEEDYVGAQEVLSETTIFEPICGRICPHKSQCEGSCIRGIKGESVQIGELEAFLGDKILEENIDFNDVPTNNRRIAIIGSGPAGIACSYYLSTRGFSVDIYEKHSKLGGLLRYGIPEFRLPKKILDKWLEKCILNKNVKAITNKELGKDITLEELKNNYEAIILAFGANISNKMNIPGEELDFVFGGNELLEYRKMPDFKNKKVAVIGGGNVAMDSVREIKRLGAKEVTIIYRRSEKEMPAEIKEIEAAKEEGVNFLFQTNILNISSQNNNSQIECIKTELVERPGEIRKVPVNIEGSNYLMDIDYVVMAVGSHPNTEVVDKLKLETTNWGYIKVDENYKTSDDKIYAVGDLIGTKQTVAWAARSGFECAKKIIECDKL